MGRSKKARAAVAFMRKDDSSTSSSSSSGQLTLGYISVTLIIILFNSHSNISCRSEVTLASSKGDELGTGRRLVFFFRSNVEGIL